MEGSVFALVFQLKEVLGDNYNDCFGSIMQVLRAMGQCTYQLEQVIAKIKISEKKYQELTGAGWEQDDMVSIADNLFVSASNSQIEGQRLRQQNVLDLGLLRSTNELQNFMFQKHDYKGLVISPLEKILSRKKDVLDKHAKVPESSLLVRTVFNSGVKRISELKYVPVNNQNEDGYLVLKISQNIRKVISTVTGNKMAFEQVDSDYNKTQMTLVSNRIESMNVNGKGNQQSKPETNTAEIKMRELFALIMAIPSNQQVIKTNYMSNVSRSFQSLNQKTRETFITVLEAMNIDKFSMFWFNNGVESFHSFWFNKVSSVSQLEGRADEQLTILGAEARGFSNCVTTSAGDSETIIFNNFIKRIKLFSPFVNKFITDRISHSDKDYSYFSEMIQLHHGIMSVPKFSDTGIKSVQFITPQKQTSILDRQVNWGFEHISGMVSNQSMFNEVMTSNRFVPIPITVSNRTLPSASFTIHSNPTIYINEDKLDDLEEQLRKHDNVLLQKIEELWRHKKHDERRRKYD